MHQKNAEQESTKVEAQRAILLALQNAIDGNWLMVDTLIEDAAILVRHITQIEASYPDEEEQ